ncbi:helix-turn-helix domain-containing protein [Sorangium sp. So ce1335]|uniref:helix-turn-helix domain-containing protein n=1 Tax=Sorangium sp. So ce1335 TaxID=3133335 RepID=UPI003F6406F0
MHGLASSARITRGSSGESRWELATRPPAPRLRPYIRDLIGYTEQAPGPLRRRELPVPNVVVIIELGPPIRVFDAGSDRRHARYPGGFVAGLDDTFTITEHDGFQRGIQVNLTPIGARIFFGVPMAELTGRAVPVRDIFPRGHARLAERLEELPTWDARFDLIERALGERVDEARIDTGVVSWAFRRIEERGGAVDMRALARELGYSQKHVIDLFREHVGVPPKLLARLVRFDRLVKHLKAGATGTWAELAQRFGYYDQAHLARDVKQFTGTTPTRARAELIDLAGMSP